MGVRHPRVRCILYALVRAFQLNDAETTHLFDLAHAASGPRPKARIKPTPKLPSWLPQMLETMRDIPALVLTHLGDPVASNPLGRVGGDMTIGYDVLTINSTPGLNLTIYLPEPGSPSADALDLLRRTLTTNPP